MVDNFFQGFPDPSRQFFCIAFEAVLWLIFDLPIINVMLNIMSFPEHYAFAFGITVNLK